MPAHPVCERLFSFLRLYAAPEGSLRWRLYEWAYPDPGGK